MENIKKKREKRIIFINSNKKKIRKCEYLKKIFSFK